MSRLWSKTDGDDVDAAVLRFTVGNDHELDARLVAYDLRASAAHAEMLNQQGHLSDPACTALLTALQEIGNEHAHGEWSISVEEEDCHTAIEKRLIDKVGEAGERIHLGRSRNDQVLAALRLYLRDAVEDLSGIGERLLEALDGLVKRQGSLALPGYTHMQRAMPSSVGLWAGGFRSELADDLAGLQASLRRVNVSPLGSAAGYGVPGIELDREATSRALAFDAVQEPVTAVQLSRGKAEAGVVFECALIAQDLGRLASDLCLFATQEFGFVKLPTAFTTGSSIMPQKRNPDVFELVRAKSTQVAADLFAILGLTLKLTSGYHRDLQLIKAPLFRALDTTRDALSISAAAVAVIEFLPACEEAASDSSLHATAEANRLVREEGLSFREAYRRVGQGFRG